MVGVVTFGYAVAAFAFLMLAVLLSTAWRGRPEGGMLLLAVCVKCVWAGGQHIRPRWGITPPSICWSLKYCGMPVG